MSKTTSAQHLSGPSTVEIVTFAILLTLIISGLLSAYYYDLQQPFFGAAAKQFYNWLIN